MGLKLRSNRIPALTLSNLPASVDEGQSISPIISFTAADDNIIKPNLSINAYWEISGVGIASTDFENVGADGNPDTTLTGYVNLTGTTTSKQFPIGIRSDNFADLNVNETATFSIYSDAARTELIQSDTFIINDTSMGEPEFDFLLVGGGAAGGFTPGGTGGVSARGAGGGGAGGVLVVSNEPIGIGTTIYCYVAPISSGNGWDTTLRENDSSGTILHYVKGGGSGGSESSGSNAVSSSNPFGGSGGGGSAWTQNAKGFGGDYGNDGGLGNINGGGGGGGGYSTAGGDAQSIGNGIAGDGGDGYNLQNFLSILSGTIAGGGGGGAYADGTNSGSRGDGGNTGASGAGNGGSSGNVGQDAFPNTGSGGGGASPYIYGVVPNINSTSRSGGNGGSGVIYLKYIAPEPLFTYSGSEEVNSYTISSGGGTKKYQVHKLTSSGSLTRIS